MYLKDNPPIKHGTKIDASHIFLRGRKPLATSLGPSCKHYAPYMCDALDQPTVLAGAKFRFARETQPRDKQLIERLRLFVRKFVKDHFPKIRRCDVSFDKYIEQTHYTQNQKEKFKRIHSELIGVPRDLWYRSFGKVEFLNFGASQSFMDVYKIVRCINGPADKWKVYSAPLISAVEKVVCKLRYFAKYIPVLDRPLVIFERLGHLVGPYYVTDYTSFESGYSDQLEDSVEGELYRHMLQDFEECDEIIKQMLGEHKLAFRDFTIRIPCTRMSGDPQTSLGNGFTNLMIMLFIAQESGIEVDGFVEGDDGLFAFTGEPDMSIAGKLGFELKFARHSTLSTTSFCGIMMSRSLASFGDPVYEIAKFAWTTSKLKDSTKRRVRMGLLRAKALSLLYCHPRCPMLSTLALKYITLTSGNTPIFNGGFWEQKIITETVKYASRTYEEANKGVSIEDRVDFQNTYGISIDIQLGFEAYVRTIKDVGELDHWTIDEIMAHRPVLSWMSNTHTSYGVSY